MSPSIALSVKRWISKSYSHCWKGFKYAEDAGKPNNVQKLEDFSEEQQAVELLRTNKGLMKNYHKTEQQSWIIQETTQIIKIQGYVNFWTGSFFYEFSYYFVLWSIYKHLLCELFFMITLIFIKIINILHILQGSCKFMSTTV